MVGLVERGHEVRALRDVVTRAAAGVGGTAVVLGPPGIGKSALLREAAGATLRARGGDLEREFPYGVARQLFEGVVRRLPAADREAVLAGPAGAVAAVLLAGDGAGEPGDAFTLEHAFYWLTVHLAERGPVVLVVDDAHWADLASLRVLLYLARRAADLRVAVVLATRPAEGPQRALLDRLTAEAALLLEPAPLSAAGVRALVQQELPGGDDAFCAACHAASGGNPFLVSELIGAVRAAGLDPFGDNATRVRATGAQSVARSVLLRLDALPPAAAAVARTLAVVGPAYRAELLAELVGCTPADLHAAVDQLRTAHLLEPDEPPRFVHGIVRDAVHDDLPAPERGRLHRAAARALAAAGAAPETVAGHLLLTPPAADRWVLDQLVTAAGGPGAAAAPEAAAAYLERALLEAGPGVDRVPLLLGLGAARYQTVGGDAASPFAEARRLARSAGSRAEATRALASALITELRVAAAWSVVEETIGELAGRPGEARELEIFSAQWLYLDVEPDVVAALLARVQAWRPDPTGATTQDRSMLALQAWTAACEGTAVDAAAAMAAAALSTGTLVHDDVWYVSVDLAVWASIMCGRYDDARRHLDVAIDSCRARGRRLRAATLLPTRSELRRRLGDVAGALEDARVAAEIVTAEQIYAPQVAAAYVLAAVEAGEPDAAWRALESYGFDVDIPAGGIANVLRFARGRLRVAAGDLTGGVDDLLEHGANAERMGRHNPGLYPWRSAAVDALVRLGRAAEAAELAAEEVRRADATGLPELRGVARAALGRTLTGADRVDVLGTAVDLLDASPFVLDAAGAHLALGRVLRREGRRTDAQAQLRIAADVATRIGAVAVAAAAREELVATGARPRRTAATGVDALTPSESRVAALAARGLTNREIAHSLFVTPKTIETHLAGAYRKLGIAAKSELAAALAVG